MKKTLLILSVFFTVLSIVFTVLPLGTLAILPIIIALVLSFLSLKKQEDSKTKKTFPKLLLFTAVICLVVVIGKELFVKEEVAKDVQFEQTIQKSKEEDKKELEELEGELE
ncbi:hypothetical protein [Flavobacterium pedocola]